MSRPPLPPLASQSDDRVATRSIVIIFAVVMTLMGGLSLLAFGMWRHGSRAVRPSGHFFERQLGPPHTVAGVEQSLFAFGGRGQKLLAAQRAQLGRYGWVDRSARVVHIPIERAMDLYLAGVRP